MVARFGVLGWSSGSWRWDVPVAVRRAIRPNARMPTAGGTPSRADRPAPARKLARRLPGVGRAPPWVWVRRTPCSAGMRPVRSVARLGEHMHELTNAWVNVRPVRASSVSFGVSSESHARSVGQCIGARCWSVISSSRFGRGATEGSSHGGCVAALVGNRLYGVCHSAFSCWAGRG
jgi:hypothetical protein